MSGIESRLHASQGVSSHVLRDPFCLAFVAVASCLFTVVVVIQSLRQGQLSVPITYDDIVYFADAAHRLQLLYDGGIGSCLRSLFSEPPHAPLATLIPLLGFAVFGVRDWAPAVANVIWVALLLLFVRVLLWQLPRWAYAAIAVSALSWPLAGSLVIESRPDIFASMLTVIGCTLMIRSHFVGASTRQVVVVSAPFGLALIAKPSISPITFLIFCASLLTSVIVEGWPTFSRSFLRHAAHQILKSFAITVLIALPYFAVAWRSVHDYIYTATMGKEKELWGVPMDAFHAATYYLWGDGGRTMMGTWFWVAVLLIAAATVVGLVRRRGVGLKNLGLLTVFLAAYTLVSVPITKSPFLGVIVSTFLLTSCAIACGSIIEALLDAGPPGRWVATAFSGALVVASATIFDWHWQNRTGQAKAAKTDLVATRRYEIIRDIADYFESNEYPKHNIFFPAVTGYLNPHTLFFEFEKRHLAESDAFELEDVWAGASRSSALEDQLAALAKADDVVLFDEGDPEIVRQSPRFKLYAQIRSLVLNDPAFELVRRFPTADADYYISIYARTRPFYRKPFRDIRPISGFLPIEGPYPKWSLPLVRWGTGSSARAQIDTTWSGTGRLMMQVRSPLAGQNITVVLDGQRIGTCDLPVPYVFVDCSIPGTFSPSPVVDLQFAKSGSDADWPRSVLFKDLWLEPVSGTAR
jgi:hypothetical protein